MLSPPCKKPADLVTFTEEILNEKLHFFVQCSFNGSRFLLKYFVHNKITVLELADLSVTQPFSGNF